MPRFSELKPEQWNAEQRKVGEAIAAGPRGNVRGPFVPLMHSPGLAGPLQQAGAYLRYNTQFEPALLEFAIIITARFMTAQYEWFAHHKLAIQAGMAPEIGASLARGERPQNMSADQEMVYEFVTELHRDHEISAATFDRVKSRFGERGAIDLVGLTGYYTTIGMVLNVAQIALPEGAVPLPPLGAK